MHVCMKYCMYEVVYYMLSIAYIDCCLCRSELDLWAMLAEVRVASVLKGLQDVCRGFYEGLSLVLTHTYVLKLAGVSCLYEVVVTVLDYEFKVSNIYLYVCMYVYTRICSLRLS